MGQRVSSLHPESSSAMHAMNRIGLQHERIFSLVGEFLSLARSDAEASRLLHILEKIIKHTLSHCRTEESMLQRLEHPSLATQSEAHSDIISELAEFREGMLAGRDMQRIEYIHVLDSLIVHHLREEPAYEGIKGLTTRLSASS